jgi:hypothetical protein
LPLPLSLVVRCRVDTLWLLLNWVLEVGLSTVVFFFLLFFAHLIAIEVPSSGRLFITSGVSRAVEKLPILVFQFTPLEDFVWILYIASFLSYFVLAILLAYWNGLSGAMAIYVTLITALLHGVFSLLVLA